MIWFRHNAAVNVARNIRKCTLTNARLISRGFCEIRRKGEWCSDQQNQRARDLVDTFPDDAISFHDAYRKRQQQAERSVIVQVNSSRSYPELFDHCQLFGAISNSFYFERGQQERFILLEYENPDGAEQALRSSVFNVGNEPGVPTFSRFLWFRSLGASDKPRDQYPAPAVALSMDCPCDEPTLRMRLQAAHSIDDQIRVLFQSLGLSEVSYRLRFLAAQQIRHSLSGIFPNNDVQIFGSSTSGFASLASDVDMNIRFDSTVPSNGTHQRLVFHQKGFLAKDRLQAQKELEVVADIMHTFLPGVTNVRKIFGARVPIVKYHQTYLNVEVDLSTNNA